MKKQKKINIPARGIISVWKPSGPTSHDIIDTLRIIPGVKPIGHAGTLDPLAEGVLVIAIGRDFTRQLKHFTTEEKTYEAEIMLGAESDTNDDGGTKKYIDVSRHPSLSTVKNVVSSFVGNIEQAPPIYSAIKIRGRRSYHLARLGQSAIMKPRPVFIRSIILKKYNWPIVEIELTTGSGVYIRAIARDIGRKLETGAYLMKLIRTKVGNFNRENSYFLNELK